MERALLLMLSSTQECAAGCLCSRPQAYRGTPYMFHHCGQVSPGCLCCTARRGAHPVAYPLDRRRTAEPSLRVFHDGCQVVYDMVAYPDFAGVTERQAAGDRKWSSCAPEVKQQLQSSDIDGVPPFKHTTRISRDQYVPQQNGQNENDRASR